MNQVSASPSAMPRSFAMTYLLISINIVTYVVLEAKGGPTYENLLAFGAKENGLIAQGEVIRLFVPMFLHAGILHLFFNMYGLYHVGRYLEILTGSRTLLLVYILSGITGNLCSFTFSQALSVGASGSLFGILLCLYVIEKYEERLSASPMASKSGLGMLLILNGVISFVIPNIDWANHLGGAIAGTVLGLAIIMRHRVNLRRLRAARFLGLEHRIAKAKFYERESLYYFILFLINVGFASSAVRVGLAERAFGTGVRQAYFNTAAKRGSEYLKAFNQLLESPKSEANPDRMLAGAKILHEKGYFAAAFFLYQALSEMQHAAVGSADFRSESTAQIIEESMAAVKRAEPFPYSSLQSESAIVNEPSEICTKPAALFLTLGFFELAGKLFECAYYTRPDSLGIASEVIQSYWLANRKEDVVRFVNIVDHLQRGALRVQDVPALFDVPQHPEAKERSHDFVPDEEAETGSPI